MEFWDIYDINKRPTGRTMKRNDWCLKDGEYHLTVLGVVARPDGTFLITKRVLTKAWAPGWWEVSGGAAQAGESSYDAVLREVKEETGLDLIAIDDKLYDSYSAIGFSNETNAVVIGKASGEFAPSTSTFEEISAAWYSREEVRNLLKDKHFAARTQAFCYMWAKNK